MAEEPGAGFGPGEPQPEPSVRLCGDGSLSPQASRQASGRRVHSDSPAKGNRKCQAVRRSRHSGQDGFVHGVSCLPPHPVRMGTQCLFFPDRSRQHAGLSPQTQEQAWALSISTWAAFMAPYGWYHLAAFAAPFGNRALESVGSLMAIALHQRIRAQKLLLPWFSRC